LARVVCRIASDEEKKVFDVATSLTRRGASALSISMHNLSSDTSDINIEHQEPMPLNFLRP
jgi:hypothetical protein